MRSARWIFVVLISLLKYFDAVADSVTPSDRVTTRLNVREGPSTATHIIGKLNPGEVVMLLGSVPRWYQVRLSSGTEGFVSKSWAELITAPGGQIRFGAWNIKKLGHGSSKNYSLVIPLPTTLPDAALSLEREHKIGDAL